MILILEHLVIEPIDIIDVVFQHDLLILQILLRLVIILSERLDDFFAETYLALNNEVEELGGLTLRDYYFALGILLLFDDVQTVHQHVAGPLGKEGCGAHEAKKLVTDLVPYIFEGLFVVLSLQDHHFGKPCTLDS